MELELIDGQFTSSEAISIITQMIHVKIKFHESKIENNSNEEDVKMRERKIKRLQKELYEVRHEIENSSGMLVMHSNITLTA